MEGSLWRGIALGLTALALALSASPYLGQSAGQARPSTVHSRAREASAAQASGEEPALARAQQHASAPAEVGRQATLETLIALAQRDDTTAASNALQSIGQLGGERALQFLSERLRTAPDEELGAVTTALASLGGLQAREALRAATRSSRSSVREASFSTLMGFDTADVRQLMLDAINGPDPSPALGYFIDCHEPRALPTLARLARSAAPEINSVALDALLAQGMSAEAWITRLLREDLDLNDALLARPPHTLGALHALRSASIARLREGAVSTGPLFDFMERDLSNETREALVLAARDPASADSAVNALARRGDAPSLAALSQLANDSDRTLSARAVCALAADPDSRSRLPLQRASHGKGQAAVARALLHINAPGARPI
ncbi:MAG TPA: HEAT repeat domain-containing protein [Polyangiaceae bacterium]